MGGWEWRGFPTLPARAGDCPTRRAARPRGRAAGGRRDPTAIEVLDLATTSHDRLLQYVRRILRRVYGFPREGRKFGVECVVSREPVFYPKEDGSVCTQRTEDPDLRLDCDTGYGTACFVTGAFGLVAASRVVQAIVTSDNAPEPAV